MWQVKVAFSHDLEADGWAEMMFVTMVKPGLVLDGTTDRRGH